MSNVDHARKTAEEWARQNQGFDPSKFNDDTTRKAAEAAYKAAQEALRKK